MRCNPTFPTFRDFEIPTVERIVNRLYLAEQFRTRGPRGKKEKSLMSNIVATCAIKSGNGATKERERERGE